MPSGRPPLSEDQIASVFRSLAGEHSLQREATSRRLSWERIQSARNSAFAMRSQWFARPFAKTLVIAPLVASAAAGTFLWLDDDSLRYEVTGEVRTDRGVLRTENTAATLDFTDESAVVVDANSVVDVEIAGDHAALVRLLSGKLRVGVKHHDDTAWRFLAGPYEVRVIGTHFDLTWEPASESFSVAMREGRVRVLGPGRLDRYLLAGERLDLKTDRRLAQAAAATPAAKLPTPDVRSDGAVSRAPARPSAVAATGAPDWATLVSTGRFVDVVDRAQAEGIDGVLSGRGPSDLRSLASAARYTGHTALAVRTWSTLRQRFGGHDAGRQAAFFLGRTYDEQGQSALALRSLNDYLRETPSGVYAAEALGRRMALVQRLEGGEAARAVATEYLNRFPKGSYAQMARGLLAER
jgi:TolA-binding protein